MVKFLLAYLIAGSSLAFGNDSTGTQDIPAWVTKVFNAYYSANDADDLDALMKLYAPDAVLKDGDQTFRGRAEIREYLTPGTDSTLYTCTWSVDAVLAGERLAAVTSSDSCIETPKSGGAAKTIDYEGGITIYERQPDGSWLIVREAYGKMTEK